MNTNYNKGSGTLSHREQMPNKIYRNQNEFKPHKIKYKNSARALESQLNLHESIYNSKIQENDDDCCVVEIAPKFEVKEEQSKNELSSPVPVTAVHFNSKKNNQRFPKI